MDSIWACGPRACGVAWTAYGHVGLGPVMWLGRRVHPGVLGCFVGLPGNSGHLQCNNNSNNHARGIANATNTALRSGGYTPTGEYPQVCRCIPAGIPQLHGCPSALGQYGVHTFMGWLEGLGQLTLPCDGKPMGMVTTRWIGTMGSQVLPAGLAYGCSSQTK